MAPFPRVQVEKCEKCASYYPAKSVHQCLPMVIAVEEPKKFRKILPAMSIEKGALLLSSDDNVGDNKVKDKVKDFNLTSGLISAIRVRPPLFDHRIMISERSESIKNKLWNEVYAELKENDHTYQRPLLNEHKMLRPSLSTELNKDLGDPDIAFGNYLLALMKDLPIQKRKKLQCQFIASVITAQDPE